MIGKRVLLVAPKFRGLYKDLVDELKRQNYEVIWMEDVIFSNRKLYHFYELTGKKLKKNYNAKRLKYNNNYWKSIFNNSNENFYFDFLLSIDGHSSCETLVNYLRSINPNLKTILYLFDTFDDNNRLDLVIRYYERVFSYDIENCRDYGLSLLPIWWTPSEIRTEHYDIFGFASFGINYERYQVFSGVEKRAQQLGLNTYIKLYVKDRKESIILKTLKKWFKRDISLTIEQNIITHNEIEPNRYRGLINSADVILDAIGHYQNGMTTRFSWAIGAGKRIITDNSAISKYPFYDPEQIFIIKENYNIPSAFFHRDFKMKLQIKKEVEKFRIDNFIKTLMS